jgi:hypothetical protein
VQPRPRPLRWRRLHQQRSRLLSDVLESKRPRPEPGGDKDSCRVRNATTFRGPARMERMRSALRRARRFFDLAEAPVVRWNYSLRFCFPRLRNFFSLRLRCCCSKRALSFSLALSTALSHSSLSSKQRVWQPTLSSGGIGSWLYKRYHCWSSPIERLRSQQLRRGLQGPS